MVPSFLLLISFAALIGNHSFTSAASAITDPSEDASESEDFDIDCWCTKSCTYSVLNRYAGSHTCGRRISWLMTQQNIEGNYNNEEDACQKVATEFPAECGECDPYKCNVKLSKPSRCGVAVSGSQQNCQQFFSNSTTEPSMHCYGYGSSGDPCVINNNNNGLNEDPSACGSGDDGDRFDTFYLWDEPDTHGKSYAWAGRMWAFYAIKYQTQIRSMRKRGIKFTSPFIKAGPSGVIGDSLRDFYVNCGDGCRDPDSVQYIDVIAVNAFCGPWNVEIDPKHPQRGCREAARFYVNEIKKLTPGAGGDLPVYITYWNRLYTTNTLDQIPAIVSMDEFFIYSPVERVYWFSSWDFRERSSKNYLDNIIDIGPFKDKTLGMLWEDKCKALNKNVLFPDLLLGVKMQL